ncbi:MAG: DNA replication and repair protein RecF [Lamprobacter sp.]|uniref:DNA replication/repair protein RecF n=1 Tax=Lamprobacter sp. TaxID=3100796 RepID=UPI002B25FCB8|nr:DNA replication and repair protein RecF [Lamprobacter sp.]MEA3638380.1 DNA replication and repair protein RecF [Lamprobacter sp.]
MLKQLRVHHFRNLHEVHLELGPGANWLIGANAAGKTALLEAIYCLSRGRSFRGRRFGSVIERGSTSARVEAWLEQSSMDARMRWMSQQGTLIREPERGADTQLPVRLICEWTHALVDGEPSLRRRFIDWNLMLWDRSAAAAFSRFRRVAAQRNAWLRSGGPGRAVWDQPYAEVLADISHRRAGFFDAMAQGFAKITAEEDWFTEVEPRWDAGIPEPEELILKLEAMRSADQERGFTYLGISRADFSFRVDGLRWIGSRGQAKVLGCMLQLAAEQLVRSQNGVNALWLVDDLDAELAPDWTQRLVTLLRRQSSQILFTALPGKMSVSGCRAEEDRMFHVEHGAVTRTQWA